MATNKNMGGSLHTDRYARVITDDWGNKTFQLKGTSSVGWSDMSYIGNFADPASVDALAEYLHELAQDMRIDPTTALLEKDLREADFSVFTLSEVAKKLKAKGWRRS